MKGALICRMTHYVDESTGKIADLPPSVKRLADHLGAIVAAVTSKRDYESHFTAVPCRKRSRNRRCPGNVQAGFIEDLRIYWECPACGDHGFIASWEDTPWDCSGDHEMQ